MKVRATPRRTASTVAFRLPAATAPLPPSTTQPSRPPTVPPGRPSRNTAAGAVRLQPGHRRGDCAEYGLEGTNRGFSAMVGPLDEYVKRLPTEGAVVIVAASYNGTPPNNAVQFVRWLSDQAADAFAGYGTPSARAPGLGRDLPGRADPHRQPASPRRQAAVPTR
ncbi:MAG: hypothetical protein U0893_24040 [Chloroflexota bacterium]